MMKASVLCTVVVVLSLVGYATAQKCLSHPCGKLKCDNVSCAISSQADCADGETYLYPGLVCECCGACLSRSLQRSEQCTTNVMDSHSTGCSTGLCCSSEGSCVDKTSEYGA